MQGFQPDALEPAFCFSADILDDLPSLNDRARARLAEIEKEGPAL